MMIRSYFRRARAIGLLILVLALLCQGQPGQVVSWGTSVGGPYEPKPGDEYMAICAGGYHSLALTAEGTLVAWGENTCGQCNVPFGNDFVAITAGLYHNLALRTDGTVVAWGDNSRGQCNVPPRTRFLAIAAGTWHSLGIRLDGTLVAWGWNAQGQCDVPPGRDYIDICGGYYHSLALKVDRSLVAWGSNGDGQCNVPAGKDFVDIAAGSLHSLALRADGTIVAWGRSSEGQCKVPTGGRFIAIAAGSLHSLALRADGHVVAWGQDEYAQCDVPEIDTIAIIAAGGFHSLAIRENRPHPALAVGVNAPAAKTATTISRTNVPTPEQRQIAQLRPLEVPKSSQPGDQGANERPMNPAEAEQTRVAPSRETRVPPTGQANAGKTEPNRPVAPAMDAGPVGPVPPVAKQGEPPAPSPALRETPVPPTSPASVSKTEPNHPATGPGKHPPGIGATSTGPVLPAAKPDKPPAPAPVSPGGTASKPAVISAAEPNIPLDLNDPIRQGLAANLYMDSGQRAVPVYHFTSIAPGTKAKQHFCTISEEEKYKLIDTQSKTWKYEGIAFFAYAEGQQPPGARPIYRFWSQSLNRYFFTMDEGQKQMLIDKLAHVWTYQGVAWYAPPAKSGGKK
jgi:hypothetical protein